MRHYLLGVITGILIGFISTTSWGKGAPQIYHKYAPVTVRVETETGRGSGVTINRAGDVLTCAHVVDELNAQVVIIPYPGEAFYTGKVIKIDQKKDLALIDVAGDSLDWKYIRPKHVNVYIGQRVFSIGHPLGATWTISEGIISGNKKFVLGDWRSQSTVVTLPGSSGGPVFDKRGRLVGLMQSNRRAVPLPGFDGLGYAVSIESIMDFLIVEPKFTIGDIK